MYPNLNAILLNDQQQLRLNKVNEIKDYFVAEIKEKELMSKRLSKYIASFVLSITTGNISIASFATVIGAPVGIASASFRLAFSISTGTVKKLLKTTKNKKKKLNKVVMLARSELSRIESKISKALINNEISHADFTTIICEEGNYRELKESIRMMNSQTRDTEKDQLIEEGKKISTDQNIKRNEIINNNLKPKI